MTTAQYKHRELEHLNITEVILLYCHYFSAEQTQFQGDNINCYLVQECRICILVGYVISPMVEICNVKITNILEKSENKNEVGVKSNLRS